MEADPGKQRSRQKRRERALQLQQEKQTKEEEEASGQDDHDESPPRSSKDKAPRSKSKKAKNVLFEEDIIDGFAIMSFKTLEELESVTKKNGCVKSKSGRNLDDSNNRSKDNTFKKKKNKKSTCSTNGPTNEDSNSNSGNNATTNSNNNNNNNSNNNNDDATNGPGSASTATTNGDSSHLHSNHNHLPHPHHPGHNHSNGPLEPPRSVSRDRFSDASTHSGSGQGYVCDVESGDEKASESGSDVYTGPPASGLLNHLTSSNGHPNPCVALTQPTPPPSISSTPTFPLCNGVDGSNSPPLGTTVGHQHPAPGIPTAGSTGTPTTCTNSQSRPGLEDGSALTSTTASTNTACTLGAPSVITPTSSHHLSNHPHHHNSESSPSSLTSSKTSAVSGQVPQSSPPLPPHAKHKSPLSPSGGHNPQPHKQGHFISVDGSSCARSLQYSKSPKSSQASSHDTTSVIKSAGSYPPQHGTNNSNPSGSSVPSGYFPHHPGPYPSPQQYGGPPPPHLLGASNGVNYPPNHPASNGPSFKPIQSSPGPGYPHSPYPPGLIKPEPYSNQIRPSSASATFPNPASVPSGSGSRTDTQCTTSGGHVPTAPPPLTTATAANGIVPAATTPSSTPTSHSQSSRPYGHHHHHHHHSHHQYPSAPGEPPHPHHHHHRHHSSSGQSVRPSPTPGHHPPTSPASGQDLAKKFPQSPLPFKTPSSSALGGSSSDRHRHSAGTPVGGTSSSSSHRHPSPHGHPRDGSRERDKERRSLTPSHLPSSVPPSPISSKPWSSTPGQLLSPLTHPHHSPLTPSSLHPLGVPPTPPGPVPSSSAASSSQPPLFPVPLAPPPPLLAVGTSGMFAPPLPPPGLSSLVTSTALPPSHPVTSLVSHPAVSLADSLAARSQQDFLHQDLNNRLLAQRASSESSTIAPLPPSPFVRSSSETHQHQHQHLHNHMHQHSYGGLGAPLAPPAPPPSLFEKIPKAFDAGVFRPSIVPSYSAAFSSLLPPGPAGASLASSLQGAFQPKTMVTPGQMLLPPFRERDKAPLPPPPAGITPGQKKKGKWCAVHVHVAWEIFNRQQKSQQSRDADSSASSSSSSGGSSLPKSEVKPLEPLLRPPSHLLSQPPVVTSVLGTSRHPDIIPPNPAAASLLGSDMQNHVSLALYPRTEGPYYTAPMILQECIAVSRHHRDSMSPFPRPSPYPPPSLLNPLSFSGLGSSMFAPVRDMAPHPSLPSGLSSSPHDWNRLHRTPSSFPSWPKSEADREKEREKEREREFRKDEERERERRASLNHRLPGMEDGRHKEAESSRPHSRSRSRSPLRNGHPVKSEHGHGHPIKSELGHYDRRYDDKGLSQSSSLPSSVLELKKERREEELSSIPPHILEREKMERERIERERAERDRLERDRLERDRIERDRLERERMEKEKMLQTAAAAEREKLIQAVEQREREKLLQSTAAGYLGLNPFGPPVPGPHLNLLDRRVGLMGPGAAGPYPFLDRPPVPTSMWSPFDKPAMDLSHRLELERERERVAMMSRLSSIPSHLAALEQERLKEQILREQQEREYELRRQYLDRLPAFSADRLRAADPLALGYFPGTLTPMFGPGPPGLGVLKSNSPATGLSGAPPPLIPSSAPSVGPPPGLLSSRSHDNSPSSSSKLKGCSPADSTSDLKDKNGSMDPDTHSR